MSEGSDQRASCQYISEIMFSADFINLPEKLQEIFLFLCHELSFLLIVSKISIILTDSS